MPTAHNPPTVIAATASDAQSNVLTFALSAQHVLAAKAAGGGRIQLLPAGAFAATDGRPACLASYASWVCDDLAYQLIISAASNRQRQYCLDYDHATFMGGNTRAAGWWTGFEFVPVGEGAGLWATGLTFTPAAAQAVQDGEYRYISAVFRATDDGRISEIVNAALTNNPALDGMAAVALAAQHGNQVPVSLNHHQPQGPSMKSLLVALGLQDTAAEHTALTAVTTLQGQVAALGKQLQDAQACAFDAAKHVPIAEYTRVTGELTALSASVSTDKLAALTESLITQGKLTAGQKPWALSLSYAALEQFAASAVANPALAGGKQGDGAGKAAGDAVALSADELSLCAAAGMDPKAYLATKLRLSLAI